eukprot:SAG31_NODE_2508_length_5589_cov_11.540073_6_plen_185_part_00
MCLWLEASAHICASNQGGDTGAAKRTGARDLPADQSLAARCALPSALVGASAPGAPHLRRRCPFSTLSSALCSGARSATEQRAIVRARSSSVAPVSRLSTGTLLLQTNSSSCHFCSRLVCRSVPAVEAGGSAGCGSTLLLAAVMAFLSRRFCCTAVWQPGCRPRAPAVPRFVLRNLDLLDPTEI